MVEAGSVKKIARRRVLSAEIVDVKKSLTEIQRLLLRGKHEEALKKLREVADLLYFIVKAEKGDVRSMLEIAWWYLIKAENKLLEVRES